ESFGEHGEVGRSGPRVRHRVEPVRRGEGEHRQVLVVAHLDEGLVVPRPGLVAGLGQTGEADRLERAAGTRGRAPLPDGDVAVLTNGTAVGTGRGRAGSVVLGEGDTAAPGGGRAGEVHAAGQRHSSVGDRQRPVTGTDVGDGGPRGTPAPDVGR